ncbi:hypothetical protein E4T44_05454 [Aureobasidium sp. EXF-8845]|nr:hypothetical protein E4T44_05454 [Aureobasidium sp. EXF-8845]KAI4850683.1 hypothetical protein E4T45_05395 [Aureobasidium sp. EXF-8846]
MSSPLSKISSFAYDDMPSPASWLSSPASKKMHSPASKLSSSASKMSVAKFEKTPTKSEMYSPIPKKSAHKAKTASMDSMCTTFSDIIRALDETHDRIASMGVKEMKQDRVDSLRVLEGGHPKGTHLRAFDTKKYMKDYENGDITLLQIQVAANATKLPEEHRADWIAVNGKLPEPACGFGKCTYDPFPMPAKRRRDAIVDNIDDAVKAVKNVFK